MLENLQKYNILLASKSPRRLELLKMLNIPFEIAPAIKIDETYPTDLPAIMVPQYLSKLKADAYRALIKSNELIITADTVVINDGKILGKPHSAQDAKFMLKSLSARQHTVISGVCLTSADKQVAFDSRTKVTFAPLTDDEIDFYVTNFEPFDKAGAYGIQEWIGAVAVSGIEGSFYNVMGLPVHQLYCNLRTF